MNFESYVQSFQNLYLDAQAKAAPSLNSLRSLVSFNFKNILIIAPHPDDECLMAGFALRAKDENETQVGVLPFTFGSKAERKSDRRHELEHALEVLQFSMIDPRPENEEELTRDQVLSAIEMFQPDTVIIPHPKDGHVTHVRCSNLALDVILEVAKKEKRRIQVLQTEFWHSMDNPNLLVPLSAETVAQMGKALFCHAGEVARNPYHLTLPAWLMDQVRRGSEIEKGSSKGDAIFGQLYRSDEMG